MMLLSVTPQQAAIDFLGRRVNGQGGVIVVDRAGTIGYGHNTPHMAVAWYDLDGRLQSAIEP
jgi:isoaspartyl peptidase/L-asparaginase-like protein (Ntn-hydrolase superfamily)